MLKWTDIWHLICICSIFCPSHKPLAYMIGFAINFSWHLTVLCSRIYYKIHFHKNLRNFLNIKLSINSNCLADIIMHSGPFFIIYIYNWGELVNIYHIILSYILSRIWNYVKSGSFYGIYNKLYFYHPIPNRCWYFAYIFEFLAHIFCIYNMSGDTKHAV